MYRRILGSTVSLVVPGSKGNLDGCPVIVGVLGDCNSVRDRGYNIDFTCSIFGPKSDCCRSGSLRTSEVHFSSFSSDKSCELTRENVSGSKHSEDGTRLGTYGTSPINLVCLIRNSNHHTH